MPTPSVGPVVIPLPMTSQPPLSPLGTPSVRPHQRLAAGRPVASTGRARRCRSRARPVDDSPAGFATETHAEHLAAGTPARRSATVDRP